MAQAICAWSGVITLPLILLFFRLASRLAVGERQDPRGHGLAAAGDATVCSLIGTAYRAFIIIYSVRLSVLQDN